MKKDILHLISDYNGRIDEATSMVNDPSVSGVRLGRNSEILLNQKARKGLPERAKNKTIMENILNEIRQERKAQNEKWGEQNHNPVEWIAIIGEEFGEASTEAVDFHFANPVKNYKGEKVSPSTGIQINLLQDYRKGLIQLSAVIVQAIESLDRNELNGGWNL